MRPASLKLRPGSPGAGPSQPGGTSQGSQEEEVTAERPLPSPWYPHGLR